MFRNARYVKYPEGDLDTPDVVVRRLTSTEKELLLDHLLEELSGDSFAEMIKEKFGEEGATPEVIYQELTGPMRLTADTTWELIYNAREGGYLE